MSHLRRQAMADRAASSAAAHQTSQTSSKPAGQHRVPEAMTQGHVLAEIEIKANDARLWELAPLFERAARRQLWWKRAKLGVAIAVVGGIVIASIVGIDVFLVECNT
eukprot:m.145310 g.145310  ORF g.145310 m.145310 type:complete len:107 (+) comp9683_c0_seq2:1625-1945(+)